MMMINIDVVVNKNSNHSVQEIVEYCKSQLELLNKANLPGYKISYVPGEYHGINHIIIDDFDTDVIIDYDKNVKWHIYSLNTLEPQTESVVDASGDSLNFTTDYILPCAELFLLWENLIYDDHIKEHLLDYAQTIMKFAQCGVNCNIINCNKVILLHGPPGTGKTSLCKALAQKLSVRMRGTYARSILIEINSHSLFSKWFSESGKLVTKMFDRIRDVCEMTDTLVCVLIDEVESLTHARDLCLNGNEPSDAVKVVNAVLTQIDNIKRCPNVLLLTTSNIMGSIDVAFVDRADVKQYIGPPSARAIAKIYQSCIEELIRVKVIDETVEPVLPIDSAEFRKELDIISSESLNLSGRMLRKMPFLACANKISIEQLGMKQFIMAMHTAIKNEFYQRQKLLHPVGVVNGH